MAIQKKILFLTLFTFWAIDLFAQPTFLSGFEGDIRYFHQSDSIYRANKVKTIRIIKVASFSQKEKLLLRVKRDTAGRISEIENAPFIVGITQTSYFTYTQAGKILTIKDVRIKGRPHPGFRKLLGGTQAYQKMRNSIPDQEIYTYKIEFSEDTLKSFTRFNAHNQKVSYSSFSEKGTVCKYYEYNKTGDLSYESLGTYTYIPMYTSLPTHIRYISYVPDIDTDLQEHTYAYRLDDKGFILERIETEDSFSTTIQFNYNASGLIVRANDKFYSYVYEYKFYP